MTNLQKRIVTSLIALPLAIFFVAKGGYFLSFFYFLFFLQDCMNYLPYLKKLKVNYFYY